MFWSFGYLELRPAPPAPPSLPPSGAGDRASAFTAPESDTIEASLPLSPGEVDAGPSEAVLEGDAESPHAANAKRANGSRQRMGARIAGRGARTEPCAHRTESGRTCMTRSRSEERS